MDAEADGDARLIVVIGDRVTGSPPQDSIDAAIDDAASALNVVPPSVRWIATDDLDRAGIDVLAGAAGVWCAPGSPYRSLEGALAGIRWARQSDVPFLGTCAGFQHGVLEFARNVLGYATAWHAEYGRPPGNELFIDELLCSLVGQTMHIEVVDPDLSKIYGTATPRERYYCRFGLHPQWRQRLHEAGLRIAGIDRSDGDVRMMRLADHPFFVLTLFVPQTSSTPSTPHPLITAFIRAGTRQHTFTSTGDRGLPPAHDCGLAAKGGISQIPGSTSRPWPTAGGCGLL